MIDRNKKKSIKETLVDLQKNESSKIFAILDGAIINNLEYKLSEKTNKDAFVSLYANSSYAKLNDIAPYLVELNIDDLVFNWWLDKGWNKYWGILCTSNTDLQSLATHFKQLLTITDYNNKEVMFRFYDPRVLGAFLQDCTDENYLEIKGPVNHYCLEDSKSRFTVLPKRNIEIKQSETSV